MGTFLIILIIIVLCWPLIKKWAARFMANRAEDFIRNATGMPPRPGSRKARRQQRQSADSSADSSYAYLSSRQSRQRRHTRREGPIIPKEYAEDVEFVETIDYSSDSSPSSSHIHTTETYHESQVSDAEWEEIKTSDNAKNPFHNRS